MGKLVSELCIHVIYIYIHTCVIGWNVKIHSLLWVIVKKMINVAFKY